MDNQHKLIVAQAALINSSCSELVMARPDFVGVLTDGIRQLGQRIGVVRDAPDRSLGLGNFEGKSFYGLVQPRIVDWHGSTKQFCDHLAHYPPNIRRHSARIELLWFIAPRTRSKS